MSSLSKIFLGVFLFLALSVARGRAGGKVIYEYDKWGNRTAVTTQAGDGAVLEKTTYTYDDYRRCTSKTEAAHVLPNPPPERTWQWVYDRYFNDSGTLRYYDPSAHTTKQWRLQYEPAYDHAGHRNVTARWFDANDRILDEYTGVIDTPGAGLSNGPDIEVHHFSYDENGQKKTSTDPLGRVTDYTYDLRNRLQNTIEPKRADQATRPTTTTLYDMAGNKTDVTFPDGTSQHWRDYDGFGQARTFIDERNNPSNLVFIWGPMKKLYRVKTYRDKDGGGTEEQPTWFSYDLMGKATRIDFPDGSSETTTYKFGQIDTFKTRKGQLKTITYDARGREIGHSFSDSTPGISRSWDDANRLRRLCNIHSTIEYAYDGAGRVISEANTIAGTARVETNYSHYPNGAVAHFQFPYGFTIRRDYNSRGQLQTVGWDDANWNWVYRLVDYHYHRDGKVDYQIYGNGISRTDFDYDERGMTKSVRHYRPGTQQNLAARSYGRDSRDRITWWARGTDNSLNGKENGRGNKFQYDAEGQLTDAWYLAQDPGGNMSNPLAQEHFQYDQLGNRFGQNQTVSYGTVSFNRRDNGLNQYSIWTPSILYYDDNYPGWGPGGNGVMMADGYVTASFNALNQPVAIGSSATWATGDWVWFGFDPLGRCVKRTVGPSPSAGVTTYSYYDGWNLVQEGPSGTSPTRAYVHGARVDEIVASSNQSTGQIAFHHYDGQGNCILLTDSVTGNIMEQYDYEAFGKPYFYDATGNGTASSAWNNRFLFTGREWLSNLRLYDYRKRMYQPELGRFMQPDPLGFAADDYNLYRYCHNDPVNKTDPMGLISPTASTWNRLMWERSKSSLAAREFDLLKQGQAYLAAPAGNYADPLKSHVAQNGETGGEPGLTVYKIDPDNIREVQGKLLISPTLNWWVLGKYIHTDIVKRELEHVNRWLHWHYNGAGAEMVNDFNTRPGGIDSLRSKAATAIFHEVRFHKTEIHKGGRHDLTINPEKNMKPDDIMNLIFHMGPRPFPHHLNDAGLE